MKLVIQPGGLAARVFEIKHPVPQSHRFTLLDKHTVHIIYYCVLHVTTGWHTLWTLLNRLWTLKQGLKRLLFSKYSYID